MERGPKALFDGIKGRFRTASTPERAGWIVAAVVLSPAVLPVLLGVRALRGARKPATQQPFFVKRVKVPARPLDPAAEAAFDATPDSFALVRIIGNDLPPRHATGQSRANLTFLLETEAEADLADCTRLWIVNRIVDPKEEAAIIAVLDAHGQTYRRIPFVLDDYAKRPLDLSTFPTAQYLHSKAYHDRPEVERDRAIAQTYRWRNAYAMHNNGGRNAALEFGIETGAKWVLPFDGNCLTTTEDWSRFRSDLAAAPQGTRYAVVPMARLGSNDHALAPLTPDDAVEEPQIAFRCDAPLRFDEAFPYGRRPKVELLTRLDVRGPWDGWRLDPWDLSAGRTDPESHRVVRAGLTRRLASGRSDLEQEGVASLLGRGTARNAGILSVLRGLDAKVMDHRGWDPTAPVFWRRDGLAAWAGDPRSVAEIRTAADEILGQSCPGTAQNTVAVTTDSARRSGVHRAEDDCPDVSEGPRMVDAVVTCALAWSMSGEVRYAEHARDLLRATFAAPTPALSQGFAVSPEPDANGDGTHVAQMYRLAFLPDAVRLLNDPDVSEAMARWFRTYLDWLSTDPQALRTSRDAGRNGVLYDLQVAAAAGFLGEKERVLDRYLASVARLAGHFGEDETGQEALPESARNVQVWQVLAMLYRSCGIPVEHQPEWRSLADAARRILDRRDGGSPWQADLLGAERWAALALLADNLKSVTGDADGKLPAPQPIDRATARTFNERDGLPPFWGLMLSSDGQEGR